MKRVALTDLNEWVSRASRKPLIIRGARQVGKSTLVRMFAKENSLELFEFNFEIDKLKTLEREEFDLQALIDEIQIKAKKNLTERSLIFFDEIQESPKLLKLLRYFYENYPDLKIIAAGSLLEIALKSEEFSFPVGRVEFYHLQPMSFQEFLWATDNTYLDQKLSNFELTPEVHEAGLLELRKFFYIGGMPEAVKQYAESKSLVSIRNIQSQLIQTYEADFPKYNNRIDLNRINRIFSGAALTLGEKVIFSKLDSESKSREVKRVIELLIDARVLSACFHSSSNSTPLFGEVDLSLYKLYFLDIGLLNSLLNLSVDSLDFDFKDNFKTRGVLAEQFVAQHLNSFNGPQNSPRLIYHLRDKGVRKAEIDFVIEKEQNVYPVEVKSTAKGHLKSLRYFCETKKSSLGIKTSLSPFSIDENFVGDSKLVNIPLYAIGYLYKNFDKIN